MATPWTRALAFAAALGAGATLAAQAPSPPAFDAVSIKPSRSDVRRGSSRVQPGRYVGVNVTLMRLVRLAYRPIEEFDGGPEWVDRTGLQGVYTIDLQWSGDAATPVSADARRYW